MRDKWGRVRKGGLKYKVYPPSSSSDDEDEEKMEKKRMNFTRMELPPTTSSLRDVPRSHKIFGMSSTTAVEDLEADESSSREGIVLERERGTGDVEMMDTGEGHVVEDIETNVEDTMEAGEEMEVGKVEVESLEKEDIPVMNSVGGTVPRSADEEAGTSSPTVIMSEETPEIICVYDSKTCNKAELGEVQLVVLSPVGIPVIAGESEEQKTEALLATPEVVRKRKRKRRPGSSVKSSEEDEWTPSKETCKAAKIPRNSHYTFRQRDKKVSLTEEDVAKKLENNGKPEPWDVLSLKEESLQRYISVERIVKSKTSWKFNISKVTDDPVTPKLMELFKKWGFLVECLEWVSDPTVAWKSSADLLPRSYLLWGLLGQSINLKDISLSHLSPGMVNNFLGSLARVSKQGKLPNLETFKVTCVSGDGILRKPLVKFLADCKVPWKSLELGDFLVEEEGIEPLEQLLNNCASSLKTFVIHGGYEVTKKMDKVLITIPKMEQLEKLSICLHYANWKEFLRKINKLRSGCPVQDRQIEDTFKVVIKFGGEVPQLRTLALDTCVEVHELPFQIVRKLETLLCGNQWNLSIRFPPEGSRSAIYGASVTSLQLPVKLRNPVFVLQVARFFPNVVELFLELPSVEVLQAFFDNFGCSSEVEELTLRVQFDFETMLESCLFPENQFNVSEYTRRQIEALKGYKYADEYCQEFSVEFPEDTRSPGERRRNTGEGLKGLKCLKKLHLEHIPRVLPIPEPMEWRKWDVKACKFRTDVSFGFSSETGGYPLSPKCYEEILKLNLEKITLKSVRVGNLSSQV